MPQYCPNFFLKAQLHFEIYTNNCGILNLNLNVTNNKIDIFRLS